MQLTYHNPDVATRTTPGTVFRLLRELDEEVILWARGDIWEISCFTLTEQQLDVMMGDGFAVTCNFNERRRLIEYNFTPSAQQHIADGDTINCHLLRPNLLLNLSLNDDLLSHVKMGAATHQVNLMKRHNQWLSNIPEYDVGSTAILTMIKSNGFGFVLSCRLWSLPK